MGYKKNSSLNKYVCHKKHNIPHRRFLPLGCLFMGIGFGIIISFIITSYAFAIGMGFCFVGFLLIKK